MKNFKAGAYMDQGYFKSFQPNPIFRRWTVDEMKTIALLSKADRQLGRLDMYSEYVNVDLYVSMHIAKEATQSSKIEGTQTNMEEAFLQKADVSEEKKRRLARGAKLHRGHERGRYPSARPSLFLQVDQERP